MLAEEGETTTGDGRVGVRLGQHDGSLQDGEELVAQGTGVDLSALLVGGIADEAGNDFAQGTEHLREPAPHLR